MLKDFMRNILDKARGLMLSGLDERPVKQEIPSLKMEKLFDKTYEEYMEMLRPSRRDLREKALGKVKIDLLCFTCNFIPLICNLVAGGGWGLIISIVGCAFFLGALIHDAKKYLDNREPCVGSE